MIWLISSLLRVNLFTMSVFFTLLFTHRNQTVIFPRFHNAIFSGKNKKRPLWVEQINPCFVAHYRQSIE